MEEIDSLVAQLADIIMDEPAEWRMEATGILHTITEALSKLEDRIRTLEKRFDHSQRASE